MYLIFVLCLPFVMCDFWNCISEKKLLFIFHRDMRFLLVSIWASQIALLVDTFGALNCMEYELPMMTIPKACFSKHSLLQLFIIPWISETDLFKNSHRNLLTNLIMMLMNMAWHLYRHVNFVNSIWKNSCVYHGINCYMFMLMLSLYICMFELYAVPSLLYFWFYRCLLHIKLELVRHFEWQLMGTLHLSFQLYPSALGMKRSLIFNTSIQLSLSAVLLVFCWSLTDWKSLYIILFAIFKLPHRH